MFHDIRRRPGISRVKFDHNFESVKSMRTILIKDS